MDLDPYQELGGTEEAFAKVTTSLAVLTDPGKRKTYDDTGRIEDDRPDNDRAAALQVIEMHVGTLMNAYITGGFQPRQDPRIIDVIARVRTLIAGELEQAEEGVRGGERVVLFLKDVMRRFKLKKPGSGAADDDPIVRGFERQVRHAEQQIADIHQNIRVRKLAHEIVGGYRFEKDAPAPQPTGPTHGFIGSFVMPGGPTYGA